MNPLTTTIDLGGIWRLGLFAVTSLCAVHWALNYKPRALRLPLEARLLWAYALVYALFILEYPAVPFGLYHTAFQATSGQAVAEILLIPLGALLAPRWIWKGVAAVVVVEALCVWFNHEGRGLMGWPSFDNAFMAMCLPFVPLPVQALAVFTIVTHHGSTALVIIFMQLLAVAVHRPKFRKFAAAALPVLVLIAYAHHEGPWFDSGERLQAYERYMTFWSKHWRFVVMGSGPGTFMWMSLLIDKFVPPLFLQMHSDWLQITFELGLVGLALTGLIWVKAVAAAWPNERVLAGVLGVAAFGLTYHPLRFAPAAFVVCLVIKEGYVQLARRGGARARNN